MCSLVVFFLGFLALFMVTVFRFVGLLSPSPDQLWLYDYVEFLVFAIPVVYIVVRGWLWFLRKLQKCKRIS